MPDTVTFAAGKSSIPTLVTLVLLAALEVSAREPGSATQAGGHDSLGSAVAVVGSVRDNALRLQDFRLRYEEALANGQHGEAEAAAKQMIGFMIDVGDRRQSPMADALASLAFVQRQRELYEPALANYEAAIGLLEFSESRLSPSLVSLLRGLGDTYMASGRAELALPVYQHALHIRHVNDGPHSLDQMDILDAIVTAEMKSGDPESALDTIDRMYFLYAREFAADSEEVLPALQRKADLLNDIGRHNQERMVYREIVRIIEDRRGEADLSLLAPFTAMGNTYNYDLDKVFFRSGPTTETGETFLKKALALTEVNPEATWLMQEQALMELGDYYTVRDVQDKARIHYRRAWNLLSSDPGRLPQRQRDLERVLPLARLNLDRYANFGYRSSDDNADPAAYDEGYVVARFTVNDRGRVTDVEIADADPAGFESMEVRVLRAVRGFIYRPRYANGSPVYTRGQLFRHDYLYRESDLEADWE